MIAENNMVCYGLANFVSYASGLFSLQVDLCSPLNFI